MRPLVSVCCISYNHDKYIRDCIEGFLIQQTDFPIEILIFDDASTDSTQDIINEYAFKHSNIRKFLQTENQWQYKRYGLVDWLFPNAQGKYIALCEGDDYWTDPYKLQKQVDFLEANPEYSVTYHRVNVVNLGKVEFTLGNQKINEDYAFQFNDSLQGKRGATLSMLFRAVVKEQLSYSFDSRLSVGDWPLECLCTILGKGYFFNESMGVYRVHSQGVNNTLKKTDFFVTRIVLAEALCKLPAAANYRPLLKKFIFRVNTLKFIYHLKRRHFCTAVRALLESIPHYYLGCLRDDGNWESSFRIKEPLQKLLRSILRRVSLGAAVAGQGNGA